MSLNENGKHLKDERQDDELDMMSEGENYRNFVTATRTQSVPHHKIQT